MWYIYGIVHILDLIPADMYTIIIIQLSMYPMYAVHKVAIIDKIKNKQKIFLHQWLASLIFRTFFSALLSVYCDSSEVGNSSITVHATGHNIILHDILFCI
jgi:hypothetical protein